MEHPSLVMAQPHTLATVYWHHVVPRCWQRGLQCGDWDLIQARTQPDAIHAPEHSGGQGLDLCSAVHIRRTLPPNEKDTVKGCYPHPTEIWSRSKGINLKCRRQLCQRMMPGSAFVGSENRDLSQETLRSAAVSGCLQRALERVEKCWLSRLNVESENRLRSQDQIKWKKSQRCQSGSEDNQTSRMETAGRNWWGRAEQGALELLSTALQRNLRETEKAEWLAPEKLQGKQTWAR